MTAARRRWSVRVECARVECEREELKTAKSPMVRLAMVHSIASAPRLSWDLNKRGESPLLDKIEWIAQWLLIFQRCKVLKLGLENVSL